MAWLYNKKRFLFSGDSDIIRSGIDYICNSKYLNGNIKSIYFRNVPNIPDHKAVISNIHIGTERGSGYWKLNTSLLNDNNYKTKSD